MPRNSVAIKRGSIMSCLRLPSASWIDTGVLGAGGGRGIDLCGSVWQRQCVCMLKKTFWGKRKMWGHHFTVSEAFGATLIRQHKPARSTGEDVSACDMASHPTLHRPGPALTRSYPPPINLPSIASGSKPSLFQLLTNHVDLKGVNALNCSAYKSQCDRRVRLQKFNYEIRSVRGSVFQIANFPSKVKGVQPTLNTMHIQKIIPLYF